MLTCNLKCEMGATSNYCDRKARALPQALMSYTCKSGQVHTGKADLTSHNCVRIVQSSPLGLLRIGNGSQFSQSC